MLTDEAPIPMLVMAVEDAAQQGHVKPRHIWGNIARLAKDLGLARQDVLA